MTDAPFRETRSSAAVLRVEQGAFEAIPGTRFDAIWLPKGCLHCVTRVTEDLEFLEIFSPVDVATIPASE